MSSIAEIKAAVESLSLEEAQKLLHLLSTKVKQDSPTTKRRIAELHAGAISMADDFDEPLPDAFWLGKDA